MKRILVIDDSPRVLDELDLVLLDVQMPAKFSDNVAGVMRKRSYLAPPVVLLSSLPEGELGEVRAWLDRQRTRRFERS